MFSNVRITAFPGTPDERDVTLSYPLNPAHDELLRHIHERPATKGLIECRMHDDEPVLRTLRTEDGRVHGIWLYVRRSPNSAQRRLLCHWPNSGVDGSHAVPAPMTDLHKRQREYLALRGAETGFRTLVEERLSPASKPDVLIFGPAAVLAAEAQVQLITRATVIRRTRNAAVAGATSTWFSPKDPPWAFAAPHVETNENFNLSPRSWTVTTGPRQLEWEPCRPGSRRDCPNGPNWCGEQHPIWVPVRWLTVDDIVQKVPVGELVRLDTGIRQGVILTTPEDRDQWLDSLTAPGGTARAGLEPSRRSGAAVSHANYPVNRLKERLEADQKQDTLFAIPNQRAAEPALSPCKRCGCQELPAELDRHGNCETCRLELRDVALEAELLAQRLCLECRKPTRGYSTRFGRHRWCLENTPRRA